MDASLLTQIFSRSEPHIVEEGSTEWARQLVSQRRRERQERARIVNPSNSPAEQQKR